MIAASLIPLALAQAVPASPAAGTARVVHEGDTRVEQAPPHDGTGMSTAYRISDVMPNRSMEFRKRVMHPGSSIGLHPIAHDEVYYVVSGTGEVTADGKVIAVGAGDAAYFYDGNTVGIRQTGKDDLVLLIAYPLAKRAE
ncbi:MAG TPA: cupin domain-containing protein [Sphingomonas sp.]|nr:cupin domain-containing protein [Sphingomonas sp.]